MYREVKVLPAPILGKQISSKIMALRSVLTNNVLMNQIQMKTASLLL